MAELTHLTEDELNAKEADLANAEKAFHSYIDSLPPLVRDDIADRAWANAFAAEVHAEYSDDLERWQVALSTAEMIADMENAT